MGNYLQTRLESLVNNDTPGRDRDRVRKFQYGAGLSLATERPLFGIGYMNFPERVSGEIDERITLHTVYLVLITETGIAGTLLALIILLHWVRRVRMTLKATRDVFPRLCMASMLANLIFGLFGQVHQAFPVYVSLAWGYGAWSLWKELDESRFMPV